MDRIDEILFLYEDDVVEMADGGRIGFDNGGRGQDYFKQRITDPKQLKLLEESAKKYGYDSYADVPDTKQKEPGKRVYGDKEKIQSDVRRRLKGVPVGKGSPGVSRPVGKDFVSPMKDPEIVARNIETRRKNYQATPIGERLQWIADNGKNHDNPKNFIKAYEKHFKHKLGSKKDALFGKAGDTRVYLSNIDGLQNTGKTGLQGGDIFSFKKGFSEEEIFKASMIQNNPKVQKKFKNLFKNIYDNVSEYQELGPEGVVQRLKKDGGNLLEDFDFIKSYSSGNTQTYGGVHRGVARNSLRGLGIPESHIVSFQSVRQPLASLDTILTNLQTRPKEAGKAFGLGASTAKRVSDQLENFLKGRGEVDSAVNKINYALGDKKFNQIFGGVNFEHTLAKQFGKDYKYLPRNYLLKGQFTTRGFNLMKRDVFDLPLIRLMKQYEAGKIGPDKVQDFIDEFNLKTNNYADFSFDPKTKKLAYTDNKVKYDLSRYTNPGTAKQELIENIKLTMSPEFQKGFKGTVGAKKQLKAFASKEAKDILKRLGCPGLGSGGRTGFQDGATCLTKGLEKLRGDVTKYSPGDQANLRKLGKLAAKGGRTALFLKNALGPAAIAGELIFEGGVAANKFMEGMPIKQALGESYINKYILGPKTQIDLEAERAKEMERGEEFAMAERGRRKAPFMAQGEYADRLRRKKRMEEMERAFPTITPEEIDTMLKSQNLTVEDTGLNYGQIQDIVKENDQMQAIANAGGVANMAGGGIAGIRKPDAIPPESGPNPQGLENLKYYVTNT